MNTTIDSNFKVERYQNTISKKFTKHCPNRNVKVKAEKPLLENPEKFKLRRLYRKGKPGWKINKIKSQKRVDQTMPHLVTTDILIVD